MPHFGTRSMQFRDQCDDRLIVVLDYAIKIMDFSIREAYRDRATHAYFYASGRTREGPIITKVKYEETKHGRWPSQACHLLPHPFDVDRDWKDWRRFDFLYGVVRAAAFAKGINLRSGADWDQDYDPHDQTFHDLCHWEVVL